MEKDKSFLGTQPVGKLLFKLSKLSKLHSILFKAGKCCRNLI